MDFQKELIAEYDSEVAKTRKMFEAIPANVDFSYKPHEKSMTLGRLAGHISDTAGAWAISVLTTNKLEHGNAAPYVPASTAALLECFDKQVAEAKAAFAKFTPKEWDENWKFVAGGHAWIDASKYFVMRNCVLNHLIHHRAQLALYLRLLNHPIPGMFGPSADEH
jgi:uncharacterized damage-inducible protein DinB